MLGMLHDVRDKKYKNHDVRAIMGYLKAPKKGPFRKIYPWSFLGRATKFYKKEVLFEGTTTIFVATMKKKHIFLL